MKIVLISAISLAITVSFMTFVIGSLLSYLFSGDFPDLLWLVKLSAMVGLIFLCIHLIIWMDHEDYFEDS